jgi:integrase
MVKQKLTVEAINAQLKAAKIRVTVRQRGEALYLRATLPPKPGSGHAGNRQYEIPLGLTGSDAGLKRAELEAKSLSLAIDLGKFDWSDYLESAAKPEDLLTCDLVKQFKAHYMATHSLKESTWDKHFQPVYGRLPQDQKLSISVLVATAQAPPNNTRNRKDTCEKLQKLADFAEYKVNLLQYKGNYSQKKVKRRDLPSDEEILLTRDLIPNPAWQWVFGVMATFGCRPHEAWFCEFDEKNPYELRILEGKTGPRVTRALYPEWVDLWHLWDMRIPKVKINIEGTYDEYGKRTYRQFTRYNLPLVPYDLRHAFAVRGSTVFNLPVASMAALMGHDPIVFLQIYQRWINESQHQQVYENLVIKKGKPSLPQE